jgi:RepB DNA-primase from phage plasmid
VRRSPRSKRARLGARPRQSLAVALEFVQQIWGVHPGGFVFLSARTLSGRWIEKGFHVKFGWRAIEKFLKDHNPNTHDLYYCPNAFSSRKRLAEFALSTRFAWCDIDGADPSAFRPQPSVLVETSPGRYQGLWNFRAAVRPARAEAVSRHLTNTYHGDRGGWSITKMLRLPGTLNHKPAYDLPVVSIVHIRDCSIPRWPKVDVRLRRATLTYPLDPAKFEARAVIKKYWAKLAFSRRRLMQDTSVNGSDRSKIIFIIIAALHDAGASPNEIAAVVWRSPYFLSKHGARVEVLNIEVNRILAKLKEHK